MAFINNAVSYAAKNVFKSFSSATKEAFSVGLESAMSNLSKTSQTRIFMIQIHKEEFFSKGSNFKKLSVSQKKLLAKNIIEFSKRSKKLKKDMEKERKKYDKELELLKKSTNMFINMYHSSKELFRDEIKTQYAKNPRFNSKMLTGLGVRELATIFNANITRIAKNEPIYPVEKVHKLSTDRLGGVSNMMEKLLGREVGMEHTINPPTKN